MFPSSGDAACGLSLVGMFPRRRRSSSVRGALTLRHKTINYVWLRSAADGLCRLRVAAFRCDFGAPNEPRCHKFVIALCDVRAGRARNDALAGIAVSDAIRS